MKARGPKESVENYLETILILSKRNGMVRSVDIANELGFSKPSISIAMKKLRESGYVEVDEDGSVFLTSSGRSLAESIYERHVLLKEALMLLGVPEAIAKEDACRIEHVIQDESFIKIKEHLQKVKRAMQ